MPNNYVQFLKDKRSETIDSLREKFVMGIRNRIEGDSKSMNVKNNILS